MPPEDAMEKYLDIVSELYPTWIDGLTLVSSLAMLLTFRCISKAV